MYLGLTVAIALLLIKFVAELVAFAGHMDLSGDHLITDILGLIDVTLVANLIVIVMLSRSENFVVKLGQPLHRW